jgi:hypothetical protein
MLWRARLHGVSHNVAHWGRVTVTHFLASSF